MRERDRERMRRGQLWVNSGKKRYLQPVLVRIIYSTVITINYGNYVVFRETNANSII